MSVQKKGLSVLAATATVAAALVTVAPAEAATIRSYDFQGTNPITSFTLGSDPFLTSVTANPSGTVVQGSNGLGIRQPSIFGIDLDSAQIDGFGVNETLNLTFNQTVRIISATFRGVGNDLGTGLFNDDLRLLVDGTQAFTGDIVPGNGNPLVDSLTGTINFPFTIAQGQTLGFSVINASDDYFLSGLEVEVIPTPALLPGLIGMGLAALRKRKGEAEQSEEVKA